MDFLLKHNTASQVIPLGVYLDDTDGKTPENGLTIANTDLRIWKTGATTLTNKNSGGATFIETGIYYATLDATDTNTLGPVVIYTIISGALVVVFRGLIVPVATYDALITNGLNDLSAAQVNAECDTALADYDGPTNTEFEDRTIVSANYATAANLATVDGVVDAILVDTNELQTNQGNWLTATGFATSAEIADVPTVAEFNARTLPSADYFVATDYTAPPSAATISTQVWSEATRTLTAGTNIVLAKGVGVTGFNDIPATDIVSGGAITTSAGFANVNISKINGVTITGDGSGTPFDV